MSEVLTAMTMRITVRWGEVSCYPVETPYHFRETNSTISSMKEYAKQATEPVCYLLGLPFNPEYGSHRLFENWKTPMKLHVVMSKTASTLHPKGASLSSERPAASEP
jgi:hypothetical protein